MKGESTSGAGGPKATSTCSKGKGAAGPAAVAAAAAGASSCSGAAAVASTPRYFETEGSLDDALATGGAAGLAWNGEGPEDDAGATEGGAFTPPYLGPGVSEN